MLAQNLLNPAVSNRFTFAESKSILVQTLGSQRDAISVMEKDPSILREGAALQGMSAGSIKGRALAAQVLSNAPAMLLLVSAATATGFELGYIRVPI